MIRPGLYFICTLWLAAGLYGLATGSDSISIAWQGYVVEIGLLGGVTLLTMLLAMLVLFCLQLRRIWSRLLEPKR